MNELKTSLKEKSRKMMTRNIVLQKNWEYLLRLIPFVLFALQCSMLSTAHTQPLDARNIQVTFDPSHKKLTTYKEYLERSSPPTPFRVDKLYETLKEGKMSRSQQTGKVLVIVNSSIQSGIQASLDLYVIDLEREGYDVTVWATSGGNHNSIKNHILSESTNLVGVVLIGDVPVPWFEMYYDYDIDNDWDGEIDEDPIDGVDNDGDGEIDEDPPYDNDGDGQYNEDHIDGIDNDGDGLFDEDTYDGGYSEFPCDLFYMDLDGTWDDKDADGLLDGHRDNSADVGPDIWLGRLTPSPMTFGGANEVTLLNNYFRKNHDYRMGTLTANERALVYVDDDWEHWADDINDNMKLVYSTTGLVRGKVQTCGTDYVVRLTADYEWIHVMVHSSWENHHFKIRDGWELVTNTDIQGIDPVALFYNLFACSNCRYVEADYMGGWYIFVEEHGLGAVGSTKSGSMLYFESFYEPLGQGASIGEAYQQWFEFILSLWADNDWQLYMQGWFYGMTLLGDPTLTLEQTFFDPDIHVSATSYNYGDMLVETSSDWVFDVSNVGASDLMITNITSDHSNFEITSPGFPQTVSPGDEISVTVTFTPSTTGMKTGHLSITSNDLAEPTLNVTVVGKGVVPDIRIRPEALDETVVEGGMMTTELTITNRGDWDLTFQITETIDWVEVDPASGTVAADGNQPVEVVIDATALSPSERTGKVTVICNDPDEPECIVPIYLKVEAARVIVSLPTTSILPGETAHISLGTDNLTWLDVPIGRIEMELTFDDSFLEVADITPGERAQHMGNFEWSLPDPGVISLAMYDESENVIEPGTGAVAEISFVVSEEAAYGASSLITIVETTLTDENGEILSVESVNGMISLGLRSDVNLNGGVDIVDALLAVNIVLQMMTPTGYEQWAADCNGDGVVNIMDVLGIVNVVLGISTCEP
ncbi:MAG: choice-of-anchor D domain-containing protein [Gemmatimonadota bacterium]|nr:MAG: choice-of-anchor D domain-containing protein [Gemmatimonadota bacterium]